MIINNIKFNNISLVQEKLINFIKIGKRSIISISKIRNNTINTKNRIEIGLRDFLNGSNPHSNAVIFSFEIIVGFHLISILIIGRASIHNIIGANTKLVKLYVLFIF